MHRLASGDVEALDELISRHWDAVVDYAVRAAGCGDSAQDLAQEAFVALWEGRSGWERGSSPRALLLQMVRNRSLNESRRDEVRQRHQGHIHRLETGRREPTPLEQLKGREFEGAFREALDELSPRRQEVFVLARFQGLSYTEIADVLGTSPQTVANQMSAALRDLRRELEPFLKGSQATTSSTPTERSADR